MASPLQIPPLRGIIPPLVTPLAGFDTLDVAALERLVSHLLEGGVSGLFVLGTTGEGPSLSGKLRRELVRQVCRQATGRVPVLVGITDPALPESLELATMAADEGASFVVVSAPYYFPLTQDDLLAYVNGVVRQSPLPVVLYNLPSHTKVAFALETVQRLMDDRRIVAIKDSSGDMNYFHRLLLQAAGRSDFSVLVGPEELLAEAVLLGAHGGVAGGANLAPRLYVDLYQAAAGGDLVKTRELHAQVLRLSAALCAASDSPTAFLRGLKGALACCRLCDSLVAAPLQPLTRAEQEALCGKLAALGILAQ